MLDIMDPAACEIFEGPGDFMGASELAQALRRRGLRVTNAQACEWLRENRFAQQLDKPTDSGRQTGSFHESISNRVHIANLAISE